MQMLGRLDAENAVKDGAGFMWGQMDTWKNSPDLKKVYPSLSKYLEKVGLDRAEKHK